MSYDQKQVLRRMAERMEQILEEETVTQTSDGDDERRSPPLIHIDPDFGHPGDTAHAELLWIGLQLVKAPYFNDETIQSELEAFVDGRDHLEIGHRMDKEYDLQIADEKADAAMVVEITEALITEIYETRIDDKSTIEWDDIEAGERLVGEEFLEGDNE